MVHLCIDNSRLHICFVTIECNLCWFQLRNTIMKRIGTFFHDAVHEAVALEDFCCIDCTFGSVESKRDFKPPKARIFQSWEHMQTSQLPSYIYIYIQHILCLGHRPTWILGLICCGPSQGLQESPTLEGRHGAF